MIAEAPRNIEPVTEIPPVIITGMSGAGLSSAARVLEDMGWYVSQNLPPQLVVQFFEFCAADTSPVDKVALVSDVRSLDFSFGLDVVISQLDTEGLKPLVLFMDARDDVLIKRFDNLRRTHPLQGSGTLLVGIERERALVANLKESADVVIDTSDPTSNTSHPTNNTSPSNHSASNTAPPATPTSWSTSDSSPTHSGYQNCDHSAESTNPSPTTCLAPPQPKNFLTISIKCLWTCVKASNMKAKSLLLCLLVAPVDIIAQWPSQKN